MVVTLQVREELVHNTVCGIFEILASHKFGEREAQERGTRWRCQERETTPMRGQALGQYVPAHTPKCMTHP